MHRVAPRRCTGPHRYARSGSIRHISMMAAPQILLAVVNHYNTLLSLSLTNRQKTDLVEYLKTL